MGKAYRKPRPSMPLWYWNWMDCCYFCHGKHRNNCNQCGVLRKDCKGNPKLMSRQDKRAKERWNDE